MSNSRKTEGLAISVVIPTLGRPILVQTLESLVAVEGFDAIEVIVLGKLLDKHVQDQVLTLIHEHPGIRWEDVSYANGDLSRKKNAGFKQSTAEIIIFIDDDLKVPRHWLQKITEPFDDSSVGMVCGPSLMPEDLSFVARLCGSCLSSKAAGFVASRYAKGSKGVRPAAWPEMIGCNMACRRNVLDESGGFHADIIPGEDLLLAYDISSMGHKLMFHPEAYVYHYPRQSLAGFCRQSYRFGLARIRMFRYGVAIQPVTLAPAALVAVMTCSLLTSVFLPAALAFTAVVSALYVSFVVLAAIDVVCRTKRLMDILVCLLIPLMHVAYGLGEWVELFRPNRNVDEKPSGQDLNTNE